MAEFARIILLLAAAAAGATFLGSAAAWWLDEQRRLGRLMRKVLGGAPDAFIVAHGRSAAAGFRLSSGRAGVMRNGGANTVLYPLHYLIGAELIVDDQVVARVMRGEPRRALDQVNSGAGQVTLRLMFDDVRYPDFSLELWVARDRLRRDAQPAAAVIREARTWLGRAEAAMRRAVPPNVPPAAPEPPPWVAPDIQAATHVDEAEEEDVEGLRPEDFNPPRLL
jgi:hypothetical protein